MNWYYVDAGQRAGPVDDAQLEELVRAGKIQADTLVWSEGMANWQPYHDVKPSSALAETPPPVTTPLPGGIRLKSDAGGGGPEGVCSECGKMFPLDRMIKFGQSYVCSTCKPIFVQKLAEGAKVGGGLNYAGFWIRFGAKFVDNLILSVIFLTPIFVIAFKRISNQRATEYLGLQLLLQFGFLVGGVAYQSFFLGKYGATPGKMAAKLKVVSADGSPISYGRGAARGLAEILSGMLCYVGYIIVAFDSEKRALHDRICNTRVIRD